MLLFADELKLVVNANLSNVTQNDFDILNDWGRRSGILNFNTSDEKCFRSSQKINIYLSNTHLIIQLYLM